MHTHWFVAQPDNLTTENLEAFPLFYDRIPWNRIARAMCEHRSGHPKRRGLGWLMPVSALAALYAKIRATGSSGKLKKKTGSDSSSSPGITVKKTKRKKGRSFEHHGSHGAEEEEEDEDEQQRSNEEAAFGDGGVWQRSILMGGKCDPLNFSGVIYYDDKGKRLDELPVRSPRSSPLPAYLSRARA